MSIDQQQNIGKGAPREGRGVISEEQRLQTQLTRVGLLAQLRQEYGEPYLPSQAEQILHDPRVEGFQEVKSLLQDKGGIGITAPSKVDLGPGMLVNNLTQGVVVADVASRRDVQRDVFRGRTLVTGICLPEKATPQSIFSLFVAKELLETNKADTLYVALPLGAYGAADSPRYKQYLQMVGLLKKLFGEQLGRNIFIVNDANAHILQAKYLAEKMASPHINDAITRVKYPRPNLYSSLAVTGQASDVVLPLLAQGSDVTLVCDYRQFESVHAGIKMAQALSEHNMQAILLTLLDPKTKDGRIVDISEDTGEAISSDSALAETSALFYLALIFLPQEEIVSLYKDFRHGTVDTDELSRRVHRATRAYISSIHPAAPQFAQELEHLSVKQLAPALENLQEQLARKVGQHG